MNKILAGILVASLAALGFAASGCYEQYYRSQQLDCQAKCAKAAGGELQCYMGSCTCQCYARQPQS